MIEKITYELPVIPLQSEFAKNTINTFKINKNAIYIQKSCTKTFICALFFVSL